MKNHIFCAVGVLLFITACGFAISAAELHDLNPNSAVVGVKAIISGFLFGGGFFILLPTISKYFED